MLIPAILNKKVNSTDLAPALKVIKLFSCSNQLSVIFVGILTFIRQRFYDRGSYNSAYVLMNISNLLGKSDKILGLQSILSLFPNSFDKWASTRENLSPGFPTK